MSKRFTLALAVGAASTLAAADPVTFWNTVAGKALTPTQGTNPVGQSRTYAILHASIHDALNAIDARYASYTPGLRQDPGASAAAAVAATSRSVLTTLIPDQALVGAAAAEILIDLFGDRIRYETTSLTLPGVSRSFRGFSDAAEENGDSRVFAGIHFPHAVRDGQRQGRSIGRAVGKLLPPVGKAPGNY